MTHNVTVKKLGHVYITKTSFWWSSLWEAHGVSGSEEGRREVVLSNAEEKGCARGKEGVRQEKQRQAQHGRVQHLMLLKMTLMSRRIIRH